LGPFGLPAEAGASLGNSLFASVKLLRFSASLEDWAEPPELAAAIAA